MIPEKGQHVRCFMRSSMVLEGTIEEWSDTQVVLKSIDGQSLMIVHRPIDDIALTKIVLAEETPEKETSEKLPEARHEIREKLEDVLHPSGDEELDKLNLQQLRQLVQEQEKQIITQKKREHFGSPGAPKRTVQYSDPFSKQRKSAYQPGKLPRM